MSYPSGYASLSDGAGFADLESYLNADARAGVALDGKPSLTIDEAASQIVRGAPGWSDALGVPFTVTYAYRASPPAVMPDDAGGFQRFNAAQIDATELALKAWSDVANIHFVRVGAGYSDGAAILLGDYTTGVSGSAAFSMFPGSASPASSDGDVWINSAFAYNANPALGNYGAMVLAHELGHAIGLAHPSDYDASSTHAVTYAANAAYYEDSRQYSLMSYFSEAYTGGDFRGLYPAAPMLDDIAAAQLEYGANWSTRTGDTVYGFNASADRPWFVAADAQSPPVFAVWDAGGTDTFDFSGYGANQLIDLRAGFFSNVGGLTGNVAIAENVTIENAVGGPGADTIHGNAADNFIRGGGGDDVIDGGSGGSNLLWGGDGADQIAGGPGFDFINGNLGDDTVHGGGGVDWVAGGQNDDLLYGDRGDDVVYGNLGDDTLEGGDGDDLVRGGQGNDVLHGGPGADWLSGDRGDDTLVGGAGADTFHGATGVGLDWIVDFNAAEGDRILLDAGTPFSIAQAGPDTVISLGSDADRMVLANVQAASLGPGTLLLA